VVVVATVVDLDTVLIMAVLIMAVLIMAVLLVLVVTAVAAVSTAERVRKIRKKSKSKQVLHSTPPSFETLTLLMVRVCSPVRL
jgi:cell division protein FtsL